MKPSRMAFVFLFAVCCAQSAFARSKKDEPWADHIYTREEIAANRELAAIQKRIDRKKLPKVQFDFDSDVVRSESYVTLDLIADFMLKHVDLKMRVTAHTCDIGTEEYNLELSRRRAKSVMTYLVSRGVPPPSLRFRGAGLSEPIVPNDTDEGREKNRRVEFRLTKRDWRSVY